MSRHFCEQPYDVLCLKLALCGILPLSLMRKDASSHVKLLQGPLMDAALLLALWEASRSNRHLPHAFDPTFGNHVVQQQV